MAPISVPTIGLYAVLAVGCFYVGKEVVKVARMLVRPMVSPVRNVPGPKSSSFFFGHLKEIFAADAGEWHERYIKEFGKTFRYKTFIGNDRIVTTDVKALSHVTQSTYIWQKPDQIRYTLGRLLGEGVLFAEGDKHKQQRRIMNPAFSTIQLRELTEIFFEKALQLRDIWTTQLVQGGDSALINVLPWMTKVTLDIIGLAGFSYSFDALSGETTKLQSAFGDLISNGRRFRLLGFLKGWFPIFRIIPSEIDRRNERARTIMDGIGQMLLKSKKAAILATSRNESKSGVIEKKDFEGRDLLTVLIKANMAQDLPESQRLSDQDVLAQIPTFLIAGHETTSISTTWALYALSRNPSIQAKLRAEILKVSSDAPTMDELQSLPYLDAVVRETLRVHSVVPNSIRVAVADDVIPLSTPFVGRDGKTYGELVVKKGDSIFLPIIALNRDTTIWGPDGHEFNPERWFNLPEAVSSMPGVLNGLFTFMAGPRACIGYRFAFIEMKVLLFTLIRSFSFEIDPSLEIVGRSAIVTRPLIKGQESTGEQMPLTVTLVKH